MADDDSTAVMDDDDPASRDPAEQGRPNPEGDKDLPSNVHRERPRLRLEDPERQSQR